MSPPPLRPYSVWQDVKDAAETFELFCSIKQIPYNKLEVLRFHTPVWHNTDKHVILPTGEHVALRLEIIRVKDYDGKIHDVGYYVKEHNGKYYVTLPVFREYNEAS